MKFIWRGVLKQNLKVVMNRLGYHQHIDSRQNQISFIRRLGSGLYPRLHAYIDESEGEILFKIHLDEKKPSYQGVARHSGQYNGEILEQEKERIVNLLLKI